MLASDNVMTYPQIDDLANKLRDAARKHRDEIDQGDAQEGLRSENIGMRLFAEFRRIVDELKKRIVHIVTVDRTRTPQQALDACGRRQYVDKKVVAAMPRGTGDKAKLVYFKPGPECYEGSLISCSKVAEEYKKRKLRPDPQAQIDDNAAKPEFADSTPNGCQWVDEQGNYCCASFDRWFDERHVHVYRLGVHVWRDEWSFAGVPEESSASAV